MTIDRSKYRFGVYCWKSNGVAVLWERFETHEECQAVVDRLAQVGCSAHIREAEPGQTLDSLEGIAH